MRLAHARPATLTLVAGGLLVTAVSAAAASLRAATGESCRPVQLTARQSPSVPGPATSSSPDAHSASPVGGTSPADSPAPSDTARPALSAGTTSARSPAATSPADSAHLSLCLKVVPEKASRQSGGPAQWAVTVWATGGTIPGVVLTWRVTPADHAPAVSLGCGRSGSSSRPAHCDLGAVGPGSARRQLRATLTGPAGAATARSARLTVTGCAAPLANASGAPTRVSVTVPVAAKATAPSHPQASPTASHVPSGTAASSGTPAPTKTPASQKPTTTKRPAARGSSSATPAAQASGSATPAAQATPPPASTLPGVHASAPPLLAVPGLPDPSPSLSTGGNAADLFPTLDPRPTPAAAAGPNLAADNAGIRQVANRSALPEGISAIGPLAAGLAVFALAAAAAVARLPVRRRSAGKDASHKGTGTK